MFRNLLTYFNLHNYSNFLQCQCWRIIKGFCLLFKEIPRFKRKVVISFWPFQAVEMQDDGRTHFAKSTHSLWLEELACIWETKNRIMQKKRKEFLLHRNSLVCTSSLYYKICFFSKFMEFGHISSLFYKLIVLMNNHSPSFLISVSKT